jgi:Ca2+/H+ antiporter, TMEM165/GDT1 family
MHFAKKGLMILLFIFAFLVPISFIVMAIWNNVLVSVLHVSLINFWQALGIFALSKILFGFPGMGWRGRRGWGKEMGGMRAKWMNMTTEEREKFKQEWSGRCGGRRPFQTPETPASE